MTEPPSVGDRVVHSPDCIWCSQVASDSQFAHDFGVAVVTKVVWEEEFKRHIVWAVSERDPDGFSQNFLLDEIEIDVLNTLGAM